MTADTPATVGRRRSLSGRAGDPPCADATVASVATSVRHPPSPRRPAARHTVLAACRLDVAVDMTVNADGTGEVVVAATVDKDVVDRFPAWPGSLVLDDAVGGRVGGRRSDGDRGRWADRDVAPPVRHRARRPPTCCAAWDRRSERVALERTATDDEVTVTMSGTMTLPGGTWDAFGDASAAAAIGGTPFAGSSPCPAPRRPSRCRVELSLSACPGDVEETTGDGAAVDGRRSCRAQAARRLGAGPGDRRRAACRLGGGGWAGPVRPSPWCCSSLAGSPGTALAVEACAPDPPPLTVTPLRR